jgi:hypothetical protein
LLDPDLRQELKQISRTVTFLHTGLLFEPLLYIGIAIALKQAGSLESSPHAESFLGVIHAAFILISALAFAAVVALRRALFSPERVIPDGADIARIRDGYSRSQIVSDALAVTPPTLGLVYFIMSGSMGLLIVTSIVTLGVMIFCFPRYETLEAAVTARIAQGWTPQATGEERHKDV